MTRKGCWRSWQKDRSARLCGARLRQGEVVAVDHLGAARIAEDVLDLAARAADDLLGLLGVVGDEPAPELARAVADDHRVAAREGALDAADPDRQEARAAGKRPRRAGIDDERAARLERPGDPALARRHRVRR